MKLKLFCPHCDLKMDANIYGKTALKTIELYDTLVMERPYCIKCVCQRDMHIQGTMIKYYSPKEEDMNRIAEL